MTRAEWLWAATPAAILGQLPSATPRKRRLFCVACCRRVVTASDGPFFQEALMMAERYADGWERRSSLDHAIRQIFAPADPYPALFVAQAVRAVCLPGMEFSHESVLDAISHVHELDTARAIAEEGSQRDLLCELFGDPFRPVRFSPSWRTDTVLLLARQAYESRDFSAMPILGDALQDAGCDNADILDHCRVESATHARGCWVVDLVLEKQ